MLRAMSVVCISHFYTTHAIIALRLCIPGARKLKCSGEQSGCRRCVQQSLFCHYSIQKQMGRPPKKRRTETLEFDGADQLGPSPPIDIISEVEKGWSSAPITPDAVHLFPQKYIGDIPSLDGNKSLAPGSLSEPTHRLKPISATAEPWPDFATTSASAGMLSMDSGFSGVPASDGGPTCPCLSYLYLCLSTISSLNSFSINRETINSLTTAARTAQSVIRCEICPMNFSTGMQNVMMLVTLLNVMADAWYKVSQADGGSLGRELSSPEFQELIASNDQDTRETWQLWLRQVLRRAVIGVPIHPSLCPPTPASDKTPDLLSLIREMENRQRRWHAEGISWNLDPAKGPSSSCAASSFLPNVMPTSSRSTPKPTPSASDEGNIEQQQDIVECEFLCLKFIGTSKQVIQKFGFHPSEYPEGVEPV